MTSTTQNNQQFIDMKNEFTDPNVNHKVLLLELENRIKDLQFDLNQIRDPEVRGFATKVYTELKCTYFTFMGKALELEHDMIVEQLLQNVNQGGSENE